MFRNHSLLLLLTCLVQAFLGSFNGYSIANGELVLDGHYHKILDKTVSLAEVGKITRRATNRAQDPGSERSTLNLFNSREDKTTESEPDEETDGSRKFMECAASSEEAKRRGKQGQNSAASKGRR